MNLQNHVFPTLAEAEAFAAGIDFVGDSAIEVAAIKGQNDHFTVITIDNQEIEVPEGDDVCDNCMRSGVFCDQTDVEGKTLCSECAWQEDLGTYTLKE